jgi:predicted hydrocarbon binding protein
LAGSYFLVQFETFDAWRSALEEIFSPSAASVILYESAKKCCEHLCERLMEKVRSREELLDYLCRLKLDENWGRISFRDIDLKHGSGRIRVDHPFEMRVRWDDERDCPFLRGFLAGFLSKLFNKDVTVTKEKCDGEKKSCEFRFASSLALYFEEAKKARDNTIKELLVKQRYS